MTDIRQIATGIIGGGIIIGSIYGLYMPMSDKKLVIDVESGGINILKTRRKYKIEDMNDTDRRIFAFKRFIKGGIAGAVFSSTFFIIPFNQYALYRFIRNVNAKAKYPYGYGDAIGHELNGAILSDENAEVLLASE